jgi:hypothetical protein
MSVSSLNDRDASQNPDISHDLAHPSSLNILFLPRPSRSLSSYKPDSHPQSITRGTRTRWAR